ncbi:hypothetical protein HELRODRAFT_76140, partial [Helobdella robusta]|uniref:Homeobox domain-containing protein n=1 Tax=Helobdella robusta TaxID=6412 RepID=T1G2F6_HELRO
LLPFGLRKQKRIRTAFSPAQLMHLEQAFESNKYVVGQERKTLAKKLHLTETQIKVWFQNRRTKTRRSSDGHASEPDSHAVDTPVGCLFLSMKRII